MVVRPFPHHFSIGQDICYVPRIKNIISKAHGTSHLKAEPRGLARFLRRILHERERTLFRQRWSSTIREEQWDPLARWISGRWAAKEAVIKAFSRHRNLTFKEILILSGSRGEPFAIVLDETGTEEGPWQSKPYGSERGHSPMSPSPDPRANTMGSTQYLQGDGGGHEFESHGADGAPPSDDHIQWLNGQIVRLSISHDGEYATAVCLAAP